MGTFEEFLGSSEPQSDEFPPYTIGPDGRPWIIVYAKPRTLPPIGDEDTPGSSTQGFGDPRGILQGEAGRFGPSRAVDAEGRPMSDFRDAFLPTINELITRGTREWEAMARLREGDVNGGGYTTRDDEEGSQTVDEFAVEGGSRRWPLNPPSSYSPHNRVSEGIKDSPGNFRGPTVDNYRAGSELMEGGIGDIKRGFNVPYGPISTPEGWHAGNFSKTAYEAPGVEAPHVGSLLRPPVAERAPSLTGNKDFGAKPEHHAWLGWLFRAGRYRPHNRAPGPRELAPYRYVPPPLNPPLHEAEPITQGRPPGTVPAAPEIIIAEPAFAAHVLAEYTSLALQNTSNERAIVTFKAREFQERGVTLAVVGAETLSRDKVKSICKELETVQSLTDQAVINVREKPGFLSMSPPVYGTAVHTELKRSIDPAPNKPDPDPNKHRVISDLSHRLKAEKSFLKDLEENPQRKAYGTKGSIRVDVLEEIDNETVCVYDIKTGQSGLSFPRMLEIAARVYKHKRPKQIIVTEVRPGEGPPK
jgi:hypothetical protein